jgi:hypothetical protein
LPGESAVRKRGTNVLETAGVQGRCMAPHRKFTRALNLVR